MLISDSAGADFVLLVLSCNGAWCVASSTEVSLCGIQQSEPMLLVLAGLLHVLAGGAPAKRAQRKGNLHVSVILCRMLTLHIIKWCFLYLAPMLKGKL